MSTAKEEFLEVVDKVAQWRAPWWLWNGVMVGLAATSLTAALALTPGTDEFVYLAGVKVGDTCASITWLGLPCPQFGMTRAFVHGARFHVVEAFSYNPAGYVLFLWFQLGGLIGAVRLAARDHAAVRIPYQVPMYFTMFWLIVLWLVPYVLRLAGINPLP